MKRILIVDDQPQWSKVLRAQLGQDYDFCTIEDAMTIKGVLKTQSFDLVITNWNFTERPELLDNFGLNVVEYLQNEYPQTPCVVVTASENHSEIKRRLGVHIPVVQKNPQGIAELSEIVTGIISSTAPPLLVNIMREYALNVYQARCLLKHPSVLRAIEEVQMDDSLINDLDAFVMAGHSPSGRKMINKVVIEARKIEQERDPNRKQLLRDKAKSINDELTALEISITPLTDPEKQGLMRQREVLWLINAKLGEFDLADSNQQKPIVPVITQHLQSDSILIAAVTKVEVQAIQEVFSEVTDKTWTRQSIGNKTYYNLGIHGDAQIFMVQSEVGIATPGGALSTVKQAIQDLHPQAVIMCGIAFGLRPDKQKLGDILVAKQLLYYEPQKVDLQQGPIRRGDCTTCAGRLLDRFRSGDNDWQGAPTHFGLVLSGEKLINDPVSRDWLLKIAPEAIGGEMEGAGLYVAARDDKVDWILVKAICDWADGTKNDDAHSLAAHNAARFVLHVLQLGGWGRSKQLLVPAE